MGDNTGSGNFIELTADIVSLHRGLNAATRRFLGAAELAQLRPGSVLINVARAALIICSNAVGVNEVAVTLAMIPWGADRYRSPREPLEMIVRKIG